MHFMKKIFLLLAAACVTLSAAADEGMWMLPYLQKMNSKDMKARGCKLLSLIHISEPTRH